MLILKRKYALEAAKILLAVRFFNILGKKMKRSMTNYKICLTKILLLNPLSLNDEADFA